MISPGKIATPTGSKILEVKLMSKFLKRVLGAFIFTIGLSIASWVAYNLLVELQPEAEGINPIPAILSSGAMMFVGYKYMRGEAIQ